MYSKQYKNKIIQKFSKTNILILRNGGFQFQFLQNTCEL